MASSLESNKIAAAVLTAGVVAMLSGFIAELLYHPHVELEENSYVVAASAGGAQVAAPAEEALEPIAPAMAAADPAAGEKLAGRQCAACHTFDDGGANKVGPNLYGVLGRQIAGHAGFAYSDGLTAHSGESWTYEHLNAFLHAPKDFAPGTKMTFRGFDKVGDRADVVAYLRTLAASPEPLPEVMEAPAEDAPAAEGETPAEGEAAQPAQ
jgi:cytochrome c